MFPDRVRVSKAGHWIHFYMHGHPATLNSLSLKVTWRRALARDNRWLPPKWRVTPSRRSYTFQLCSSSKKRSSPYRSSLK